jgi:hypothetical protein
VISHGHFRTVCGDGAGAIRNPVERAVASPELNHIDRVLAQYPQVNLPLHHLFPKGIYVRECFIPKGTLCTTKIHKTEHPFVISMGRVSVWTPDEGTVHLQAPHTGITKPGTRRLIYAHEDVIWSTFHRTDETDLKKIEAAIIEPHDIPFLIPKDFADQIPEDAQCMISN